MDKTIPIYKAVLATDENGMYIVSFVDDPATQVDWQAYENEEKPMEFAVENEEKRIVRGVLMRANHPIYRYNDGNPFYAEFDPETLREMAQRYLRNNFQNNVDTNHNYQLEDGVFLQEIFLKDVANGIDPKGFEKVEDGSLFGQFKVENDDVWSKVKDGTFKGFSIVAVNAWAKVEEQFNSEEDAEYNEIVEIINKIKNKLKK